jgi:hypothetical protein
MNYYAQINKKNVCVGLLETEGTITADHMIVIEPGAAQIGQLWTGTAWETVEPTEEEKAKGELENVEREAGMNRAVREALLIIGEKLGVQLPRLQAQENRARAARRKLKMKDDQ